MNFNPYNFIKSAVVGGLLLSNQAPSANVRAAVKNKKEEPDYFSNGKINALLPHALLDTRKASEWSIPFKKQKNPEVFYYSFAPLEDKDGQVREMTKKCSDAYKKIVRRSMETISSGSNVEFRHVNQLEDAPSKARKISIRTSNMRSLPPIPTAQEVVKNINKGKNKPYVEARVGALYERADGSMAMIDEINESRPADAKLVVIHKDLLNVTGANHTEETVTHELLHVMGLAHPCENIKKKLKVPKKDQEKFLQKCAGAVSEETIMDKQAIGVVECLQRESKLSPIVSTDIINKAVYKCSGYDKLVLNKLKRADIEALELLVGKKANVQKRGIEL
jgi:hypothetical protein